MAIFAWIFAGSGVQDQLDALAIPTTPTSDIESPTSSSTSVTGCHQCMGLSQLSFAASTLSPAAVHNHGPSGAMHGHSAHSAHSLHLVGNHQTAQNLAQHLTAFQTIDNRQNTFQNNATLQTPLGVEAIHDGDVSLSSVQSNHVKTETDENVKIWSVCSSLTSWCVF